MIQDLARGLRVLERGGRIYLCRKPTLETVAMAIHLFAAEIGAAAQAWRESAGGIPEPAATFLPYFLPRREGDERLALLLASCVELEGSGPGALVLSLRGNSNLQAELAAICLQLVRDLPRAIRSVVGPLTPEEDAEAEDLARRSAFWKGISPQEVIAVDLAERFSCTPTDILRMPWEAILRLQEDVIPRMLAHRRRMADDATGEIAGAGDQSSIARQVVARHTHKVRPDGGPH